MFLRKKFIFLFLLSISNINAKASNCPKLITLLHTPGIHFIVNMCTTASSFGAAGDGVTDDTYALLKAFSSGQNLDLEGKKYLIDLSKPGLALGLTPNDNTIIEGNGAEIILKPNNMVGYSMITLINSKNVKIFNLKLIGDVKKHFGSYGEWGMGFSFLGAKNCELHQVEANEMWGDGFYLSTHGKETNEGGGIFNSSARANRRVGLSMSGSKNFTIKDCNITDTGTIKFTTPAYGIDIEPNPDAYDSINGLKLINIKTENNLVGGWLFLPRSLQFSTNPNPLFNIYVKNCISKNDGQDYWYSSGLRLVESISKNNYNGIVNIEGFKVINPPLGSIPFRWQRNDVSSLTVNATELEVDGVAQYDYHY